MEAQSYWEKELRRKSDSTQTSYTRAINLFLEWADLTMEELYNRQKTALASEDLRDSDEVHDLVLEYLDHLEDEGLSNSTQNMTVKAVALFFEANKLHFPTKKLRRRRISGGVDRVSKEDIHELYLHAMGRPWTKLRNKTLYIFLKDSGLRVSDASNMNIEDYLEAQQTEVEGVPFKVFTPFKTQKTGDLAHAIIGPEAISHIDKMIGDRKTGPLFVDFDGKRWLPGAMANHVLRTRRQALGKKRVSAHSFRKFFVTSLEGAGVPEQWIRAIHGKSTYEYSKPDPTDLLKAYARSYDALRILPSEHLESQVRSLSEEVQALRQLVHDFTTVDPDQYIQLVKKEKETGNGVFTTPEDPE